MTGWQRLRADWTPPAVSRWGARRLTGRNVFREFAGTWAAATDSVPGYGDAAILARVADATRAVERGDAAFERDSVLFDQPDYSWPLMAALAHRAAADGRLSVLDFGGSLGSSYRQNRQFLDDLPEVAWGVVEQDPFVALGRAEFATQRLSFHRSPTACAAKLEPNLILLASTLQYLPEPHGLLDALAAVPASTLVIDRTPMSDIDDDLLCIQQVPATIYEAQYPMWVLSRSRLLESLGRHWEVEAEYDAGHGTETTQGRTAFRWRGLILTRR
jgi:putative methyltransferase (TIGR04325 family)